MTRELRLDLDPWLESARALGPMIDPNLHSCGTVPPHGYKELAHPEPGYFAVGIKSYGRAPTFLMATGYEQVRSVAAHLAGDEAAANDVRLVLPETGVCSTDIVAEKPRRGCCGGPAPANADACCVDDANAKASGRRLRLRTPEANRRRRRNHAAAAKTMPDRACNVWVLGSAANRHSRSDCHRYRAPSRSPRCRDGARRDADSRLGFDLLSARRARQSIARDTGWRYDWVVGGVSVGLLVAGIVSPRVGRAIARHGGRPVLAIGALLLAAGLRRSARRKASRSTLRRGP